MSPTMSCVEIQDATLQAEDAVHDWVRVIDGEQSILDGAQGEQVLLHVSGNEEKSKI